MDEKIGSWAFIIGVVIAILAGLLTAYPMAGLETVMVWVPLLLVLLGLIVGFLNIGDKEVQPFLLAAIALVVVGIAKAGLADIPAIGPLLVSVLGNIAVFAAPAVLIVSLIEFHRLASTPKGVAIK